MYSDRIPSTKKRQQQYDDKWKHDLYENNEEPQVSPGDEFLQSMPGHNELYGPHLRAAYNLQRAACWKKVRQYHIGNESNKRKRGTQQLQERGTKERQEENAGDGSVWEDHKRTILAKNKSSTWSHTFADSEREQDMNQQKEVQTKTNVLVTKRQSREESKAEGIPHQVVSQSNLAITLREASIEIQMQGEGDLHLKKKVTSLDMPDIIANSSRRLSEGTECDSRNQIQPHCNRVLDCDESNQKKKGHPPVLEWRYQFVMNIDSEEDTQSQTCSGEDAIEVQSECPLEETATNTLSNTEDEQHLSLRFTESLLLADTDDNLQEVALAHHNQVASQSEIETIPRETLTEVPVQGEGGFHYNTDLQEVALAHRNQVASQSEIETIPREPLIEVPAQGGGFHYNTGQDMTDSFTNPISLSDHPTENSIPGIPSSVSGLDMDVNLESSMSDGEQGNAVCLEGGTLLFTKTLSLWKTFERMEVFQSMPQTPHFRTLSELNENLREGIAIGLMLAFVAVVEKTQTFQPNDTLSSIRETLELLNDLEVAGFNVKPIRARLEKLISIKTMQLDLDKEMKQVEEDIIVEEKTLESEIDELTENLRKLGESSSDTMKKKEMLLMKKQANDTDYILSQKRTREAEKELEEIKIQFNSVAASLK